MQTKTGLLECDKLLKGGLSIVIPMYNEELRIANTLHKIFTYLNSDKNTCIKKYEIILVDDGSSDNTVDVIDLVKNIKLIRLDKNYGKGKAVRTGILESEYKFVLYIDADNAVDISNIEILIPYLNNYKVIIGSRKIDTFSYNLNIRRSIRHFISLTGVVLNKTLVKGIYDTQCPFKLMEVDLAKKIFKKMKIDRYAFDLEFLFLTQKDKVKVKEVSIDYRAQTGSKFRIIRDVYFTFLDFIKIHINFLFGKYN